MASAMAELKEPAAAQLDCVRTAQSDGAVQRARAVQGCIVLTNNQPEEGLQAPSL